MISGTKFFVSLLVCVLTVYLGISGFNLCLEAISYPDTLVNIAGVCGIVFLGFCVCSVVKFLKGYCS